VDPTDVVESQNITSEDNSVTVSSVGFPFGYSPNGDIFKYLIRNPIGGNIKISFDDWCLDYGSEMKFYLNGPENNPTVSRYGASSRPFLMSNSSEILLEFRVMKALIPANRYLGFTARLEFMTPAETTWANRPTLVSEQYYYSEDTASISAHCGRSTPYNSWMDHIWVMTKLTSFRIEADTVKLTLGQVGLFDNTGESLEIRKGNSSLGEMIDWTARQSVYFEPSGMYVRLRMQCTSSQRSFTATLQWTRNSSALGCSRTFRCTSSGGTICSYKVCDKHTDCFDSSDERGCFTSTRWSWWMTTSRPFIHGNDEDYPRSNNYGFISIFVPVILVSVIILIVSCVVIGCMLKRKRLLMERARMARERPFVVRPPLSPEHLTRIIGESDYGLQQHLMNPPSYDDAVAFTNSGFTDSESTVRPQPPPYSAIQKPDERVVPRGTLPPVYPSAIGSVLFNWNSPFVENAEYLESDMPGDAAAQMPRIEVITSDALNADSYQGTDVEMPHVMDKDNVASTLEPAQGSIPYEETDC